MELQLAVYVNDSLLGTVESWAQSTDLILKCERMRQLLVNPFHSFPRFDRWVEDNGWSDPTYTVEEING